MLNPTRLGINMLSERETYMQQGVSPAITRSNEDFPHPEGPVMTSDSPLRSSKHRPENSE